MAVARPSARQHSVPVARPVGSSQAYLSQQQQPQVIIQQQPVYVHPPAYGRPYGYGYGRPYGYYDPYLASGVGLLGGLLIADALFW